SSHNRLGVVEGSAGAFDLGEDFGTFGLPGVGFGGGIALGKIRFDVAHQLIERHEVGWGWFYLSTVLDDFSRYILRGFPGRLKSADARVPSASSSACLARWVN
ncbi:MAG: hypothetical protein WBW73_01325, partial [Rhodoplanes sp.]